jgi:DNA adenine methylase
MATRKINKADNLSKATDTLTLNSFGAKPFLKWAGGKGQLLQKFQELYPQKLRDKKIKNYYEPFLGSGAVYFDIAQNYNIEKAWLYDINPELVLTYQVVQQDAAKLIDFLYRYEKEYLKLSNAQREINAPITTCSGLILIMKNMLIAG